MKDKDYLEYCNILDNTIMPSAMTDDEWKKARSPLDEWVKKHTPSKLYKFRECNENNINAFRNQQIWFATGAKMNDDYDAILHCNNDQILKELSSLFDKAGDFILFNALKDGYELPTILYDIFGFQFIDNVKKWLQIADKTIIRQMGLSIKSWAEEGFKAQFPFITQSVQKVIKISSFSENIGSPLMWGHYAANSSGFALAYDFRNGYYNECPHCEKFGVTCPTQKYNDLLPIVYSDKRIDTTEYARYVMQLSMTQNLLNNFKASEQVYKQVLATITCSDTFMQTKIVNSKFKDWDYEKEWRMIVRYNSPYYANDQTAYIRKKPCALYLGRKIKETDELVLRNIAYKQRILIYKMQIDEASDNYELKPIKQRNTKKELTL